MRRELEKDAFGYNWYANVASFREALSETLSHAASVKYKNASHKKQHIFYRSFESILGCLLERGLFVR